MSAVGSVVWLVVVLLAIYAARIRPDEHDRVHAHRLILAGAISPAVVLAILLIYGLALLPGMVQAAPEGTLRISVQAEQWWWRFRYEIPGQPPFESANVLHLPVDRPVEFHVTSLDVIHSLWIPSIGGKVDLIPGRVNRLVLHPTRTGDYRGTCAEFCGRSHALMSFDVHVLPTEGFEQWVAQQAAGAPPGVRTE